MDEQTRWDEAGCRFRTDDSVAVLTLNRPHRRNAVDLPMRAALAEALRHVARTPAIRALVLTGAGGSFCAGGDIASMRDRPADIDAGRMRMREAGEVAVLLSTLDRPVIAAVDGPAYGAGFGLALAADFIIGTDRARFSASFIRIGLIPDCLLHYSLTRWVGAARARELIFSGREVGAREAIDLGILSRICEPDALQSEALTMARRFRHASPVALAQSKAILNRVHTMNLHQLADAAAAAQALCFETTAHRDAAARFMRAEPPLFAWDEMNSQPDRAKADDCLKT